MAQAFSKRLYRSRAWEVARAAVIARQHNLCADCMGRGELSPIEEVHHVVPLTAENVSDPSIAYGLDNLVGLCRDCHMERHRRMGTYRQEQGQSRNPRVWFDESGVPRMREDMR